MAHILVADDEPDIRQSLASWLSEAGHQVTLASDGGEALARIEENPPDALILDVMMPWMDGFEVLKALRQDAATRELPVIMLTAKSADGDVFRSLWSAHQDFLCKPLDPGQLMRRLDWILRTGRAAPIVLVVDDEDHVRLSIARALRAEGLRIDWATGGKDALERVTRYRPDLIILDHGMPKMDGLEVQRQLKAVPSTAAIPIIMLLLFVASADQTREWQRSAEYWLFKPISPVRLAQGVVQLVTGADPSALNVTEAPDFGAG